MTAQPAAAQPTSFGRALRAVLLSEYLVLWLSVAYVAAVGPFTPGFFTGGNFANILITLLPLFIVALGQTVVLITGGIDLSVTSIMALASVTGAIVMNGDNGWLAGHPLAVPAGVLVMLAAGAFIGLLNGAAITRFRMPPFIVTLTGMMFFSGFAIWLTKSKAIGNLPAAFNALGGTIWISFLITLALAGFAQLMLDRSVFGRWLYAVGHNAKASHISGVPVNGVIIAACVFSGFCAAVASVLYTGQGETGSPVLGQRILLDIIGATVIGGTSLFGGKGKIVWTLFGVLFLKLIDNSLNLLNLSIFSITMVKGVVILFAAVMDALRNRWIEGAQMNTAPALQFDGIEKSFNGVRVLKDVNFALSAGRTLGLIGENGAGKSTLMNILGGNHQPDAGQMQLDGQPYAPRNPMEAARCGVAFIHQELNLFPNLSIAENIFLTDFPKTAGLPWIQRRALRARSEELLAQVGLNLPPETLLERLSAGERQLVEIARALSIDARLIIFDEPTTPLSARETESLFALMQRLRARGLTMIYVSHILGDVLRLCDDLVVLRDGEVVGSGPAGEFTTDRMISLMVGRSLTQLYPTRRGSPSAQPVLEVKSLSQPHIVHDINFTLHRSEVLGISGLIGAGRSELARILFGLDPHASGEIRLDGKPLGQSSPLQRIQRGLAFLTEDRRAEGLCLEASIADNIALVSLRQHASTPFRLIDASRWRESVRRMREAVRLTSRADDSQPVKTLSGGNQQKVVLAKWLLAKPAVLILDEPTRGIDVGAKFEVYQLIHELADRGAGVLVISSEIEELIGICDRILVMRQGEIAGEFQRAQFDRQKILAAALHTSKA